MRDRMRARGPDDASLVAKDNIIFAHRRLAIRDREGGKQPVKSPNGRFLITYNGEIYNDTQLREQLRPLGYHFRTRCDTEVLAAAWEAWQSDCVYKLRGMFAFGVYDFRDRELTLVRDRFGVKPLFYARIRNETVFASSIAAIKLHPGFSSAPDFATLRHYLSTFRLTLGERTVYDGVSTVEPAQRMTFRNGRIHRETYWVPPRTIESSEITFEEAADRLETLVDEAVSMRLISDVPVGMMLSGGVDSSLLAHVMADKVTTGFVARCGGGTTENDHCENDFHFATKCADHIGLDFDQVRIDSSQYLEGWHHLVSQYETPVSTPTDVIIHQIAKNLRQSVGVVIGGEGADEACCGYQVPHWSGADFDLYQHMSNLSSTQKQTAHDSLQKQYGDQRPQTLGQLYLACNGLIPESAQAAIFHPSLWDADAGEVVRAHYDEQFDKDDESSNREKIAHVLLRLNLESLLARLDSATMLESLEARVPYTDHLVVEQLFRLPHTYRIDVDPHEPTPWRASLDLAQRGSLRPKRLIHALARRRMPPHLANRPKASFPTPLPVWLQQDWKQWLDNKLLNSEFAQVLFRPAALHQLSHMPPSMAMWKWPLTNVLLWVEQCFA